MAQYFSVNYTGGAFRLFALPHLLTMLIMFAGILGLILWLRKSAGPVARKRFRYIMVGVLVCGELIFEFLYAKAGLWSLQLHLPLHLCAAMAYVGAFVMLTKNKWAYEFLYFPGMCGALQAILTPSLTELGFPHFLFFQTFFIHGAIVLAALYMTVVEKYRPKPMSFVRVFIGLNLYMVVIGFVNRLLGSNYMFIAHKPLFPSLIDFLGPWPWYILSLEAVGLVVFIIAYLPFLIKDIKQKMRAGSE